ESMKVGRDTDLLADRDTDLSSGKPSEYLPRKGEPLAKPAWKDRDYIKPLLPKNDPHRGDG
ncbi:MAG: hypothetical protein AAF479_05520, partial [Pseudomonadota bacterium]